MVHAGLGVCFHYGECTWSVQALLMGSHSGHQNSGYGVQRLGTLAGVEQNWIQIQPFKLTSCMTLIKWFNLLSHL